MKVKNIMFSGFAAAILMGAVAEANAAPVAVASKGYVDSIAGTLTGLDTTAKDNLVSAINEVKGAIPTNVQGDIADGTYTTEEGFFYEVDQTDGKVTAKERKFDTAVNVDTSTHTNTAPTTKAVYTAIEAVRSEMPTQETVDGKQDKSTANYQVGMVDGEWQTLTEKQIGALDSGITSDLVDTFEGYATTKQDKLEAGNFINIDEETGVITTTYAGSDNITIGTDGTINTIFPQMPDLCSEEGATCVLTSEGGKFAWVALTKPVSGTVDDGRTAQAQPVSEPVVAQ